MRNIALSAFLIATAALAQTPAPAPAPRPAPIVSPEVLPDHRVTFRLRAPKATEVTITGDFWLKEGRVEKLTKDDQGVFSLTTTEILQPDYYSYSYSVDGVHIPDPANGLTKPGSSVTQSAFWVPGTQAEVLQDQDVPHGEVRIVNYKAASIGKQRRMHIYFPPGYEEGKDKYPVVYLFHGGGDDDGGWIDVARANFTMDNLIAQGKAKPMILVMPSLSALDPSDAAPAGVTRAEANEALFQKTLLNDVIPYVESHYRVLPGPANRAVGGLGAGREFLPDVLWPNMAQFDNVLFVSGGADAEHFAILDKKYPGVVDDPHNVKRMKFFFGDGVNDASYPSAKNLSDELKKRGYKATLFTSDNTHGWPEFRLNFIQFVQTAFK